MEDGKWKRVAERWAFPSSICHLPLQDAFFSILLACEWHEGSATVNDVQEISYRNHRALIAADYGHAAFLPTFTGTVRSGE
jgi:hypothetical protein